jgi:hypothetical protein
MRPLLSIVIIIATAPACTDPLAGNWQSHGPELTGDFEIFLEDDLTGRVDLATRDTNGMQDRVEDEVTATRVDRNDGIWSYTIAIEGEPDLECDLDRRTDELECEWRNADLEFEPYEEDDSTCEDACELGAPRKSSCNACIQSICDLDKYCCSKAWDVACRARLEDCGQSCGG